MMKHNLLLLLLAITFPLLTTNLYSQNNQGTKAGNYGIIQKPIVVPSLAQQLKDGTFKTTDPNETPKLGPPKQRGANITVPGKGLPKGGDALVKNQERSVKHDGKDPSLVFNANTATYTPSDPTGAVGPNHFIGGWNVGFRIFDKEGNPLTPPASLGTLFPGNIMGDPIVFYDAAADRFVITEFDSSPNGFNMAICQGSDPVNDGWYIYTTGFGTGQFPDYTKFSVWSDGYYVTANIGANNKVFAVERDEMLLGNAAQFVGFPLTGISTSGFYSPQFFNVSNNDLPPAGNATVVYMQDDAWSGVSTDHLKLWSVNVDWTDIANSTISAPAEIITTPFISVFDGGSFSNVPQPSGPDQDVLQATIMNQAQYRRFPDHNSAIFNFVVDTDGSGAEMAGIRWFELRQANDSDPWTLYQEGTYISPYNNKHAFSGSMVMDGQGNIGMGYTTVSSSEKIAIHYTGRYDSDPLGEMTIDETLIAQGTSNNPSNRLADYVQISVDPVDDKTFWHIAEYFINNQRTDVVGVFQIASNFTQDVGVINIDAPSDGTLSDAEPVTITIFNYGDDDQTDIPVSYQINGGAAVIEMAPGTLASGTSMQYTFSTTANLGTMGSTYEIKAFTDLAGDEYHENDTIVKSVMNLSADDIGVTDILTPVSGSGLTTEEPVTVTLSNFGFAEQSNFDVTYYLNDISVTEQVPGPLSYNSPINYTFSQTCDMMSLGSHLLTAYTSLPDDANRENDTTVVEVINTLCQPQSNCNTGSGIFQFKLGTIDNTSDCSENGYHDFTDLSTDLEINSINDLTIATYYGSQNIKVWIDYNDNFVFEPEEVVVDNFEIAPGMTAGYYIETMPLTTANGVSLGEHILRAKSNMSDLVPEDACEGTTLGETEDYKVNLTLNIGIENNPLSNSEMVVKTLGNNVFDISLESAEINETLIINLHNVLGQKLVENRVKKENGKYSYHLDLSYAKPGAYIVRLGSGQFGKVKRIVVR
ncbi:MAG: GEVED domain-containing protein [Bacteroidales bacterium]|nr:GEVED domain-containing protein [Bacteroidales bacterium]